MSLEQIKQAVALLDGLQQAELIGYALRLRYAQHADHQREVVGRFNAADKSNWLTPDEFERRLS